MAGTYTAIGRVESQAKAERIIKEDQKPDVQSVISFNFEQIYSDLACVTLLIAMNTVGYSEYKTIANIYATCRTRCSEGNGEHGRGVQQQGIGI